MDRLKSWLPWVALILIAATVGLQILTMKRIDKIESDIGYLEPDASEQYDGPPWAAELQRDASDAAEQARKAARSADAVCKEVVGSFRCR